MSSMTIIDRRPNGGKSLENRQRFTGRIRGQLRHRADELVRDGHIGDTGPLGNVRIDRSADDLREPSFRHEPGSGSSARVLPGNRQYVVGDTIARPNGGSAGGGSEGSTDGSGDDSFQFVMSWDEFLDLFFEDLELPNLTKKEGKAEQLAWRRAGYTNNGPPSRMSIKRTVINAKKRQIALKRPKERDLRDLERRIGEAEARGDPLEQIEELRQKLEIMRRRRKAIRPFLDIDLRYRLLEQVPVPVAQAVMFCLMDVSGSMGEHEKDLAKRFFMLLHIFLTRQYRHVEIVFIRHTHEAAEVDEDTFFHATQTGGTVVSTAFAEMRRIIRERYPMSEWNIYAAQASDGDNASADTAQVVSLLVEMLPILQYFAYIEVDQKEPGQSRSMLWHAYRPLRSAYAHFATAHVTARNEIFAVFRKLFAPRTKGESNARTAA